MKTENNDARTLAKAEAAAISQGWRQTRGTTGHMVWSNPSKPAVTHDDVRDIPLKKNPQEASQIESRIYRSGHVPPQISITGREDLFGGDLQIEGRISRPSPIETKVTFLDEVDQYLLDRKEKHMRHVAETPAGLNDEPGS